VSFTNYKKIQEIHRARQAAWHWRTPGFGLGFIFSLDFGRLTRLAAGRQRLLTACYEVLRRCAGGSACAGGSGLSHWCLARASGRMG
jgi:hypothetical protein